MPLQIRRGSTADRNSIVPLVGELVFDTTTGAVYIGDGTTAGGLPVTEFSVEDAKNTTVGLFLGSGGSDNTIHSGITFQYAGNRLIATVAQDLSNYIGLIVADQGFKGNLWADDSGLIVNTETKTIYGTLQGDVVGSVFADNSVRLVDGVNSTINLDGTVKGDIVPDADSVYDLGSSSNKFKDLYLSGSSLYLGNAVITATGSAVNLPAGSTVNGSVIGTLEGDLTGSVFADNSTVMINGPEASVNLDGTIKGDVTPAISETYDLGSFANKFQALYLKEGDNLYMGNAVLGSAGSVISLPAGSTVGGVAIGTGGIVPGNDYYINIVAGDLTTMLLDAVNHEFFGTHIGPVTGDVTGTVYGNLVGDVKGSVFGDDSTMLVDGTSGRIVAPVFANVTGNVTGDLSGNVNGDLIGNVTGDVSGNVSGDLTGSVYSTSAVQLINGATGTILASAISGNASGLSGLTSTGTIAATNDGSPASVMTSSTMANNSTADGLLTTWRRARGTIASPTSVNTNDYIGNLLGLAHDGTTYTTATAIASRATGTISSGIVPGQLEFSTADCTGTLLNRIIIEGTGVTQINGSVRQVNNTYSNSVSLYSFNQYHATTDSVNIVLARGRGTYASPATNVAGDEIAEIVFSGTNTSNAAVPAVGITVSIPDSPTAQVTGKMSILMNNGTSAAERFVLENTGVVDHKQTALVAGGGSGQVDTSSVTGYYRVKVNGVEVAVPYYSINP